MARKRRSARERSLQEGLLDGVGAPTEPRPEPEPEREPGGPAQPQPGRVCAQCGTVGDGRIDPTDDCWYCTTHNLHPKALLQLSNDMLQRLLDLFLLWEDHPARLAV